MPAPIASSGAALPGGRGGADTLDVSVPVVQAPVDSRNFLR
jgi:hypothetical protein